MKSLKLLNIVFILASAYVAKAKNNCSSKILSNGYDCCSDNCKVVYTDKDGTWGYEKNQWCGCTTTTTTAPTFCNNSKSHSGQSVKITGDKTGSLNGIDYEIWSDGGNNNGTFYSDGSFTCTFNNIHKGQCLYGLSFDSTKTYSEIGQINAEFKVNKQVDIGITDYTYIGAYGWFRSPLAEFYIIDSWLTNYRPGDWIGNKKFGEYMIDGAIYAVYQNTRYNAPSIEGNTTFRQYISVRKEARDCGTINVNAHFKQWEALGMELGKLYEVKVLGEMDVVTKITTYGTVDFPYAKVYVEDAKEEEEPKRLSDCSTLILEEGYECCSANCKVKYIDEFGSWGFENNSWCGCGSWQGNE